jgi:hypothetical protein
MKFLISLFLLSSVVFASDCDIEPLKKEIIAQYKTNLPVSNEKGEVGYANAKNFVVSDYLMKVKNENFLIANFELDIKWIKGTTQSVKTLVVATVDPATCQIDSYESGDTLGSSVTSK